MKITNKTVQEEFKKLQNIGIDISLSFEGYPARAVFKIGDKLTVPLVASDAIMFLQGFTAGYDAAMKSVNG